MGDVQRGRQYPTGPGRRPTSRDPPRTKQFKASHIPASAPFSKTLGTFEIDDVREIQFHGARLGGPWINEGAKSIKAIVYPAAPPRVRYPNENVEAHYICAAVDEIYLKMLHFRVLLLHGGVLKLEIVDVGYFEDMAFESWAPGSMPGIDLVVKSWKKRVPTENEHYRLMNIEGIIP